MSAQPIGIVPACDAAVASRVCETCGKSFVRRARWLSREGRGRYCSMACTNTSADRKQRRAEKQARDKAKAKARILGTIEGLAKVGEPLPGNTRLAQMLSLGIDTAREYLRELQADGIIKVKLFPFGPGVVGRQVTIIASGLRTAEPKRRSMYGATGSKRANPTELEKAKTRLRQRGHIVFNAYVTDGRAAGDAVRVDNRCLSPAEVIAEASQLAGPA